MNIFECLLADSMNDEFKAQLRSNEDELFNVDLRRFDRETQRETESQIEVVCTSVCHVCVFG